MLVKEQSADTNAGTAEGGIPEWFLSTRDHWHERNIDRFGEPK